MVHIFRNMILYYNPVTILEVRMEKPSVILLPCRGDPVAMVWLPPSREIDALCVEVRDNGESQPTAVRRRAHELGLEARLHIAKHFPDSNLIVWICWVVPGQSPKGLERVFVNDPAVLGHPVYGEVVRAIWATQRRSA